MVTLLLYCPKNYRTSPGVLQGHEARLDPNSPDFYNLATVMKHVPDTLPPGFEEAGDRNASRTIVLHGMACTRGCNRVLAVLDM